MTLKIEMVIDPIRLAAIHQEWQQLWERSGGYIFQHHDWITGWLHGVRSRQEIRLQTALIWEGGRLCGAMPCAVHRQFGLRILTWAGKLFSDYCDCLLDPAYDSTSLLQFLWDGLRQFGGFDVIALQQIRPDAKCREFFDRLARDGSRLQFGDREHRCVRIERRWPDGESFFCSLSKNRRYNHTRGKRILTELGGEVSFRVAEPAEDASSIIDEIIRLKEIWLQATDPNSSHLGCDRIVLRTILEAAVRSGLARIFLLESGGKIAAASINFVYLGRMEAYFTAYNAFFSRGSPGTVLIVEYARWSFDQGLDHVDLLRGDEAFKFRLANAETRLSSFIGARTVLGQMALSGHRWLSRLYRR